MSIHLGGSFDYVFTLWDNIFAHDAMNIKSYSTI